MQLKAWTDRWCVNWSMISDHPSMAWFVECKISTDWRWWSAGGTKFVPKKLQTVERFSLIHCNKLCNLFYPGGWRIIVITWKRTRVVSAMLWMKRTLTWATWRRIFYLSWCWLPTSSMCRDSWTPSPRWVDFFDFSPLFFFKRSRQGGGRETRGQDGGAD